MSTIGKNIKAARLGANLSQEQLAERTSVSRNYITQIETGRKKPAIKLIKSISRATGTNISELLKGDQFIDQLKAEFLERARELSFDLEKIWKDR